MAEVPHRLNQTLFRQYRGDYRFVRKKGAPGRERASCPGFDNLEAASLVTPTRTSLPAFFLAKRIDEVRITKGVAHFARDAGFPSSRRRHRPRNV